MSILMCSKDLLAKLGCSGNELARMYSESLDFYEKKLSDSDRYMF